VYRWIQTDTNHCPCLPNSSRSRLCLLLPQASRLRSPLTAGARKGLFCADSPELSEGARIRCSSPSSSASGVEPTSRPPPRRQRAAVPPPERRPSGASRGTAIRAHAFGSLSGSHALVFAVALLILFAEVQFSASCDGCTRFCPGWLHVHAPFCVRCVFAPVTARGPWGASWVRIVSGRRMSIATHVSRARDH